MVRSRLEAHRHFVTISSEQAVRAILPPVRQEAPPRIECPSRKIRRRDVFDPSTEQFLGFIAEDGLDPAPDCDVGVVVVCDKNE